VKLVLASANPDKVAEIAEILVEDGETLEDNARLKAVAVCEAAGLGAVADDTGLEVDALGGAPGVLTARFAGDGATYADNVTKMLVDLDGVPEHERTAQFRTVALVHFPDGSEVVAEGVVHGRISLTARGDAGFGYDPIFVPDDGDGRTFAEMTAAEKHAVSHRGRAFRALAEKLAETTGG